MSNPQCLHGAAGSRGGAGRQGGAAVHEIRSKGDRYLSPRLQRRKSGMGGL